MSKSTLGHKVVTVKTKRDLIKLFDEDDNGNNGREYLEEGAEVQGFDCNADYFINEHVGDRKLTVQRIENLVQEAYRDSDYYINVEWEIVKVGKVFIVSVATLCI